MLLTLSLFASFSTAADKWFLTRECDGTELVVRVKLDDDLVFQARGPACKGYADNRDGQWQKTTLSAKVRPRHAITWSGYRDEPFDSPADADLTIDLWLAGAKPEESQWLIGVSVYDDNAIYTNTLHLANLETAGETCVAPGLCIMTAPQ